MADPKDEKGVLNRGQDGDGSPPGHNDRMEKHADDLDKGKEPDVGKDEQSDLPEWLPSKFAVRGEDGKLDLAASSQKLAESYAELEKSKSKGKDDDGEESGDDDGEESGDDDENEDVSDDEARDIVERAGLDPDEVVEAFLNDGDLTEEHYEALEKQGVNREQVGHYLKGVRADIKERRESAEKIAGDEYDKMLEWAEENFSAEDIQAYNQAVLQGKDSDLRKAVNDLKSQYEATNGSKPKLVRGGKRGGSARPFADQDEMVKAMQDPRYKTSPAYRAEIDRRLEVTKM